MGEKIFQFHAGFVLNPKNGLIEATKLFNEHFFRCKFQKFDKERETAISSFFTFLYRPPRFRNG